MISIIIAVLCAFLAGLTGFMIPLKLNRDVDWSWWLIWAPFITAVLVSAYNG